MLKSIHVLGSAALLTFTGATPAVAAAVDCAQDHVCMWEDPTWSGSRYVHQVGVTGDYGIGGWNGDNEISSVVNYSACTITLYNNDSPGSSTRQWTIRRKSEIRNLKTLKDRDGVNANDDAESYRISC
ncbi:peptidase inhibitor family I36 protein [Allokutzneria sp. A3M-2-11 16]|uniref:peptidase inhibitor family I36 protein n=1 Tax=Allokutzneria sp. A3M-2-11 16 TaxID=2962043 RepID=UPI0020B8F994|nr:peptidase inhibitor family I36 protein [Allokutzneria sp. A3M-2-11 16]MCP3803620.1 peptidase inhibitor family I36 protein [Allokutzneria sp. A3M-2-11 16]